MSHLPIALIKELRRELPASIQVCRDAITSANGDMRQAYEIVAETLTDELMLRTETSRSKAVELLKSTDFNVERAFELWRRDNPLPEPSPQEKLELGRELAGPVSHSNPMMRRYVYVIPRPNNYELRLITHHEKYTDEAYGWDYDYAMFDTTTRVQCKMIDDIVSTVDQIQVWGCKLDTLIPSGHIDSCLLNSPIDCYLDLPHLKLSDDAEI